MVAMGAVLEAACAATDGALQAPFSYGGGGGGGGEARAAPVVGLDAEWQPDNNAAPLNPVSVLQVRPCIALGLVSSRQVSSQSHHQPRLAPGYYATT